MKRSTTWGAAVLLATIFAGTGSPRVAGAGEVISSAFTVQNLASTEASLQEGLSAAFSVQNLASTEAAFLEGISPAFTVQNGGGIVDVPPVLVHGPPAAWRIHPGLPNPFVAETILHYDVPRASDVKIRIFDVSGRLVRTVLSSTRVSAGYQAARWDGRDDAGRLSAAGIYFCRLEAPGFRGDQRLVLFR